MAFKIGTRVKKVRGNRNVGATGVIVNGPTAYNHTLSDYHAFGLTNVDCYLKPDSAYIGSDGIVWNARTTAANSSEWEPIIPEGHAPCEEGFSLDNIIGVEHAI